MDTVTPLKQLVELQAKQCGPGSLPGWSLLPWPAGQEESMAEAVWSPLLDISESQDEYLIQAELPGVKKDSVKIMAEENTLTITGKREFEKEAMSKKRLRTERAYGSFGRRFSLPDDANAAKVGTDFIDGVLTVRLAKKEKMPKQEEVVDEITAWWQNALGTKAVLGQASNRSPPGPGAPAPKLLWTKPEGGHAQQESNVAQAVPRATEEKGTNNPGTQERKARLWRDRSRTALGQLKHWSGVMFNGTVFFLAVVLLRFAVAVLTTIRAALGLLTAAFKRVRCWPSSVRGFLLQTNPRPGEQKP